MTEETKMDVEGEEVAKTEPDQLGLLNKKTDFMDDLQATVPKATEMAQAGSLTEALEQLLLIEKKARLAQDLPTMNEVCLTILRLSKEYGTWDMIVSQMQLLCKRRSQKTKTITSIVQEVMKYLDDVPEEETKVKVVVALREITDGKIYVEHEFATLTQILASSKEAAGDISGAADILGDVHVETYGSMTKLEKVEYILEQMRLTLAKKDFVRAFIISRKVKQAVLLEAGFEDARVRFHKLLIAYYTHESNCLELAKCWFEIYDTKTVQQDEAKCAEAIQHACIFAVLAQYDNHQSDLIHRISTQKKLEKFPEYKSLLKLFITKEVAPYPLPQQEVLYAHPILSVGDNAEQWKIDLHTRVIEHNVRIISGYYARIRIAHLASTLGLNVAETEKHISTLVSNGSIYARMDRPAGIINFSKPKPADEILSDWASDISELLACVDSTSHLINKENMLHKIG